MENVEKLKEEVRRKEIEIKAMMEIGKAATTLILDDLLQLIMEKVAVLMEANKCTLYLLDEDRGEIYSRIIRGTKIEEIRLKLGQGIAGWTALTGDKVNIRNAYKDPRFYGEIDKMTGHVTKTILCLPMKNPEGKIVGVIQVLDKAGGFDSYDEKLLESLSSLTAVFVTNAKLYDSLERRNKELIKVQKELSKKVEEMDMLLEVAQEISSAENQTNMLIELLDKVKNFLEAEAASILLRKEKGNELYFRVALGEKGKEIERYKLNLGQGIAGWVAEKGEPLIVNDVTKEPRWYKEISEKIHFPTREILCVPLKSEDNLLGSIEIINKRDGKGFDDGDLKLLTLISAQIAQAVEANELREKEAKAQRLATVGQMVSGLMHDFKTPITSIMGFTDLLSERFLPEENRKEYLNIVRKELERLTGMIKNNLDFVSGKRDLFIQKIFLSKFLEEFANLMGQYFKEKGINLQINAKYEGAIRIDENKMTRVFYNIAKNAIEAMPQGGNFTIQTDKEEERVVIRFIDTGVGIPEEIRDTIFESFVTLGKKEGTGLGLTMVKKIIEEHKGDISVHSQVGKGSTFTIHLPL